MFYGAVHYQWPVVLGVEGTPDPNCDPVVVSGWTGRLRVPGRNQGTPGVVVPSSVPGR